MKKFGLLLASLLVLLAIFVACADTAPTGGDDRGGGDRGGGGAARSGGSGIFAQIGSALAVNNATSNLQDEISERLATTPFQAFGMLWESINHGTTTVSFDLVDEWERWDGTWQSNNVSGNFDFASDINNFNFALSGDVTAEGESVDFSVFLNRDRVAVGSSLIGEYYGINFRTFQQDMERLLNEFGLGEYELSMITEIINEVLAQINTPTPDVSGDAYIRLIANFLTNNEVITNDVQVNTGRETVNARRVTYTFTDVTLFNFLRDYLNELENDANWLAMFESPFFEYLYGTDNVSDMIMREMRGAIREMENYFNGELSLSFYIGERDRLLRVDGAITLDVWGEEITLSASLSLGSSATDIWRLELSAEDGRDVYSLNFVWEIRDTGGRHINEISGTLREGRWTETFALTSDWNPSSGDFVISVTEGNWHDELMRGNFTTSGGTFRLSFDTGYECCCWLYRQSFVISTARGVNIRNVNFVNIAGLGLSGLEDLFEDIFGGMGFGGWDDPWGDDWSDSDPWDDWGHTPEWWFYIEDWSEWYILDDMIWIWQAGLVNGWDLIRCNATWDLINFDTWIDRLWAGYYGWDWSW